MIDNRLLIPIEKALRWRSKNADTVDMENKPCTQGHTKYRDHCIPNNGDNSDKTSNKVKIEIPDIPKIVGKSEEAKKTKKILQEMRKLAKSGKISDIEKIQTDYNPNESYGINGVLVNKYKTAILSQFETSPKKDISTEKQKSTNLNLTNVWDQFKKVFSNPNNARSSQKIGHYIKTESSKLALDGIDIPKTTLEMSMNGNEAVLNDSEMNDKLGKAAYQSLSKSTQSILKEYTDLEYNSYNNQLREGKASPELKEAVLEYLDKAPELPIGTQMTRRVFLTSAMLKELNNSINCIIQEPGFSSASVLDSKKLDEEEIRGDVEFRITSTQGAKGIFAGSFSALPKEGEMLLPPGSRFFIKSITLDNDTDRDVIECFLLPTVKNQCC